jgi:DNA-binding CsgD family transcriptional regulator
MRTVDRLFRVVFVTTDLAPSRRLSLVNGARAIEEPAPDRISDVHPKPGFPSAVDVTQVASRLATLRPRRSIEGYTAAGHALVGEAIGAQLGFVAIACRGAEGATREPLPFRVLYALGRKDVEARRVVPTLRGSSDGEARRLRAVCHVGDDVEIHLLFDRDEAQPPFDDLDRRTLAACLGALEPFAQRVALGHGAGAGRSLLTKREREATAMLLGARAQKCFSDDLGTSDARAREVVRNVYAKLSISSRAELCAAWLAGEDAGEPTDVQELTLQRTKPRPPV